MNWVPHVDRFRRERERGSAVLELPLLLGLVVIPFAVLILSLPVWLERQSAATEAAAEIARSVAVTGSEADNDELLAAVEQSYDLPAGALRQSGGMLAPGQAVVVEVTVEMPIFWLPVFGSVGARSWTTIHVERLPDYGAVDQ